MVFSSSPVICKSNRFPPASMRLDSIATRPSVLLFIQPTRAADPSADAGLSQDGAPPADSGGTRIAAPLIVAWLVPRTSVFATSFFYLLSSPLTSPCGRNGSYFLTMPKISISKLQKKTIKPTFRSLPLHFWQIRSLCYQPADSSVRRN